VAGARHWHSGHPVRSQVCGQRGGGDNQPIDNPEGEVEGEAEGEGEGAGGMQGPAPTSDQQSPTPGSEGFRLKWQQGRYEQSCWSCRSGFLLSHTSSPVRGGLVVGLEAWGPCKPPWGGALPP